MFTRSKGKNCTDPEDTVSDSSKKKDDTMTDMDKLDQLHSLLMSMTDKFQNKLDEISNDFQKKLQATKNEINDGIDRKLQRNANEAEIVNDVGEKVKDNEKTDPKVIYIQSDKLIDLPKFDGSYSAWPTFIAQYKQSTKSQRYDNTNNNTRLSKALTGPAKELIEPLLINPENVPQIIEDLENRFGRPDLLADEQVEAIRSIPKIPEKGLKQIISLADKIRNCKNFLVNCGCKSYLDNPILVKEMSKKLPLSEQIEWAKHEVSLNKRASLIDLSEWLTNISKYLELIPSQDKTSEAIENNTLPVDFSRNNRPVQPVPCPFCQKSHQLEKCTEFKQLEPSQRLKFASENKICFSCLKKGHTTKFCRNRQNCTVPYCTRKHNELLHIDEQENEAVNSAHFEPGRIMKCQETNQISKILFQIIPVKVFGPKGSADTYAMFDSASDVSLMDTQLADQIGIEGRDHNLKIKWLDNTPKKFSCKLTDVNISGTFKNAPTFKLHNIRVMNQIDLPTQSLDMEEIYSKYNYLTDIPVQSYRDARPRLLLSLKEFKLSLTNRPPIFADKGPIASQTKLGWMIYGPTETSTEEETMRIYTTLECDSDSQEDEDLNIKVQKFINSEDFGCKENAKLISEEEKRSLRILNETVVKTGERYESRLLWISDEIKLPNNFLNAVKRFESIEKKMEKDPNYKKAYESKIMEYVHKGYAEEISPSEIQSISDRTWYLPHFGVVNKNKPGKFRLVFDAAAKYNGTSLNLNLISCPDLNQPLLTVLFKFRENLIGICGDIKEMFHQVNISKKDQDSQRFVFRAEKTDPLKIFRMKVMTFGAACSPTTAQYVKNMNAEKFTKEYPMAVNKILYNHYVDDYVCCFNTEDEAIEITKDVIKIHNNAGFLLRGFVSNSKKVAEILNSIQSVEEVNMDIGNTSVKTLGLYWNIESDSFTFKVHMDRIDKQLTLLERNPTKREILSIVMSIFDPFGFVSNYTIQGKLLLQKVWRNNINWDEQISDNIICNWKSWITELANIENFQIPRFYGNNFSNSYIELHVFVDASSEAFAAVAYYRILNKSTVSTSLVSSKSKCAPLKVVSIPRLELQAAVLGVRLMKVITECQSIKTDKIFFWSDSSTVLFWIRNEKRQYKQFVSNRLAEILESSNQADWYKVPTKDNSADQATRTSKNMSKIIGNEQWLHGPQWLKEGKWPSQTLISSNINSDIEIKTQHVYVTQSDQDAVIIDYERFSNYSRLIRTLAWVHRFITYCKSKKEQNFSKTLLSSEIRKGETILCRLVQKETFQKELIDLKERGLVEKTSKLYNLNPILDEDHIIRAHGRLDNAPTIPLYTKNPVILSKEHYVTELFVSYTHKMCQHMFQELTICEIRKKFWINDLRTLVNKIQSQCTRCKVLRAKPKTPLMGQLPEDRLTPFIRPFTYTGVDYFGPVKVSVGRTIQKRWIAIFTCLTVRAVHIEIAEDLSSDACIICIRNFVNIRGLPKRMRSDNGSNFVGINNELKNTDDILGQQKVQDELSIKNIEWKFNVPSNPSAGGCWERMVGLIKRILTQSLKEVAPKTETLRSYLIEACNILNSRPLTHVPTSILEEEPLTPNDFLLGESNNIQRFSEPERCEWTLKKQWRIANNLKNHFWKRFVKEYIPTLNKRTRDFDRVPELRPGNIVLIADDNLKKNAWPRGIVLETIKGNDSIVRSALVRCRNKNLRRPVCKLAIIGEITLKPQKYNVNIEGNIGCGKSTVLSSLGTFEDIEVLPEPIEKWTSYKGKNLLQQFYDEPNRYAYEFQCYAIETMLENHMQKTEKQFKIMERSLFSSKEVFLNNLLMKEYISKENYEELSSKYENILSENNIKPDVVIYIRTDPIISFSRIKKRGRFEETKIAMDLINDIHILHEEFIRNLKFNVKIVDGNKNMTEVLHEIENILKELRTN